MSSDYQNKVAVITGAGSGIGRTLSLQLAARGAILALSDIDAAALQGTLDLLPEGTRARAYTLNVASREAVFAHAEEVRRDLGPADFVFNNAGVTMVATIEHSTIEEIEWLLGINLWGTIYGSKAFLPMMLERGSGHIINFSSIFGLIAFPCQGAYNISKFAVRGFSECLAQEVRPRGVGVTCVHPGGIRTAIATKARFGQFANEVEQAYASKGGEILKTPPEDLVRAILEGVAAGKRRVLYGHLARTVDWLSRLLPNSYEKIIARQIGS